MFGTKQDPLDSTIERYLKQGYRLDSKTTDQAVMVKPKKFSFLWAIIWTFFTFGFGIFVYLFWYMSRSDQYVYIHRLTNGKIHTTKS